MDVYIITLLLVVFGQVQSFSSRSLCDVRIWYLNLVANDVFNMELNEKQADLKNNIETLVLNSSEKPESRFKDCHVLDMYNDMLKESLSFDYSTAQNMRDYVVRKDQGSETNADKATDHKNNKNANENNEVEKDITETKQVSVNKDSEKDIERTQENKDINVLDLENPESKRSKTDNEEHANNDTEKVIESNGSDKDILDPQNKENRDSKKDINADIDADSDSLIESKCLGKYPLEKEEENGDSEKENEEQPGNKDFEKDIENNESDKENLEKEESKDNDKALVENKENKDVEQEGSKQSSDNEQAKVTIHETKEEVSDSPNGIQKDLDNNLNEVKEIGEDDSSFEHNDGGDLLQEDDIDETEIFDEEDDLELFEDDIAVIQEDAEDVLPQDTHINSNEFEKNTTKVNSIPFGICWSFGCLWTEIFAPVGNTTFEQKSENVSITNRKNTRKAVFTITICYKKTVCTKLCYYIMLNGFCLPEYESDSVTNKISVNILENNGQAHNSDIKANSKIVENLDTYDLQTDLKKGTSDLDKNKNLIDIVEGMDSDAIQIKRKTFDLDVDNSENLKNKLTQSDKDREKIEDNVPRTNTIINENLDMNQHKTIEEMERDFMVDNEQPLKNAKEAGSRMSLDDFEKLIQQKTSDYAHKIQSLELMIVNLEKQLLLEQLNKQNHTSYYTRLENLVLKLENDLLRMNKFYQNLKDETDSMNQKQNHYLELAYKQEQEKKYLELPDKSSKNFELITQHQSKIAELTDILKNQSNMINQLKNRHDSLEEQNRMLHQMVMNQTIFMTSIIQTVQDLSEQNTRSKLEMLELKHKLDNALKVNTPNKPEQPKLEEKHSKNMIDTIDSYASDTKVNIKSLDEIETVQTNTDTLPVLDTTSKWCTKEKAICPACIYNSVMIRHCVPYSRLSWFPCKETCKMLKGALPISPDVEDSVSGKENLLDENITEDIANQKPEMYDHINKDMAIIEDKPLKTIDKEAVSTEKSGKSDETLIKPDEKSNSEDKNGGKSVESVPAEPAIEPKNKPDGQTTEKLENIQGKQIIDNDKIKEVKIPKADNENKQPSLKEVNEQKSEQDIEARQQVKGNGDTKEVIVEEKSSIDNVKAELSGDNMVKEDKVIEINKEITTSDKHKENEHNKEKNENKSEDKPAVSKDKPKVTNDQEPKKAETKQANSSTKSTKPDGKKTQSTKKQPKVEPLYKGREKQKEPKDCFEIYSRGSKGDGIYKIRPLGSNKVFEVFCDMKKGGWTVIQRRQDGSTNFFLGWDDYKKGFGGLYGEHWIGNDALHYLTNQDYYKLRVDLIDWEKNKKFADFDYFLVENEDEGYRLHVDEYSGDAGDGLSKHNGHKFSTKDVDNDKVVKEFGGSCANRFHGAGWYYKCYQSNLNGKYYKGGKIPEKMYDGVTWKPWTGPNYSIKKVVMKVRPTSAKDRT